MARSIDDKVVAMSFESDKFERGVSKTQSALDNLKKSLEFPNAGKGLENVAAAARRIDLSHISAGADVVRSKLGALNVAAVAIFANIAQRAVAVTAHVAKSFTIKPVLDGFKLYELQLNSVQTILANTQAAGTKLSDVNEALRQLNIYSNQTIYNFGQMAKNVGTFTAAGVDLKTSVASIKGIANLAALSGSSADQAATAMYQLSQAISAGQVHLQDWNSVVNAGMGGATFQRALAQTAEAMGKLKKGTLKLVGPMKNVSINGESFRQSLQVGPGKKSWLTSDVLTTALASFTGDMTAAQLKAKGFTDAQIKATLAVAKTAKDAATKVKTFSQLLDITKETAATGWAQSWGIIFGNFGEARTLFTNLSNAINNLINKSAQARNKVLGDWKELGGRTKLIAALKDAFHALADILKPIREAFRDIFPKQTGESLFKLTLGFATLTKEMKPSPKTVEDLRRTFRGLFALLDIGKQLVVGIFHGFKELFKSIGGGNGGFLDFTANIGDFIVKLDKALKQGDAFTKFFTRLGAIISVPINFLKAMAQTLANLFTGFSPGGFSGQMNSMTNALSPLHKALHRVSAAWDRLMARFRKAHPIIQSAVDALAGIAQNLGSALYTAVQHINFEAILQVIRTGLLVGIFLMFRKFFSGTTLDKALGAFGRGLSGNIGKSLFGVNNVLKGMTGSLQAMQTSLKAKALRDIAIAVALLAAAAVALSFADPKRLNAALGSMVVMLGALLASLKVLDQITTTGGALKIPFLVGSLILLAGAIDLLVLAVLGLSRLSWDELKKGLGGVVVLLGTLTAVSKPLAANAPGMIRAGIGITAIAVGLNVLALAVRQFGSMDLEHLGKGLGSVGASLVIITRTMMTLPVKGMIRAGIGLTAMAFGLNVLALAVRQFGSMGLEQLGKGLGAVGASLVIIIRAMMAMPEKRLIATGAALILVGGALNLIALAVAKMGGMSVLQIAKAMTVLAASLEILSVATKEMSLTVKGSAALLLMATAIGILAPALFILGKMSWISIIKSMTALAGALAILGLASLAISSGVPALIGLGVALTLIGAGLALAGAGVALIGIGLSAIAVAGPTAVGILVKALDDLTEAMPRLVRNMVLGLLSMVQAFADTAPAFVKSLVKILDMLLEVIIKSAPKIRQAAEVLIGEFLKLLADKQDDIIQAGFDLLISLLNGIKNNIGEITKSVADIIVNFLNALKKEIPRIVTAGFGLLIAILKGIAQNVSMVVRAGAGIIVHFVTGLGQGADDIVKAGTRAIVNFVTGLGRAGAKIAIAGVNAALTFLNALSSQLLKLIDSGAQILINFLNGVADVIDKREPEIIHAFLRIGWAIIDGMIKGLDDKKNLVFKKIKNIGHHILHQIKQPFIIRSPSQAMFEIGQLIMLGLANGLDNNNNKALDSAKSLGNAVIGIFKRVFQITSPSKVMENIGKFVVQGFAKGLTGTTSDIDTAFGDLNQKLIDQITNSRGIIGTELAKVNKLVKSATPDMVAIRKAQAIISKNEDILKRSTAAHDALVHTLSDEKKELLGLANEYARISDKLKSARDVLKQAQDTRSQAVKDFTTQYATLPDITTEGTGEDQLKTYEESLQIQAKAVAAYGSTLQKLRKLGLDDATYQKLLSEGTNDQKFADSLLSGGKSAVDNINRLDTNLSNASKKLSTSAANNLYQFGVDAAQGFIDGLISKRDNVKKAMQFVADDIVSEVRTRLKSKSPSEVFADIGRDSMLGMALGFADGSKLVTKSAGNVSDDILVTMRKSMGNISSMIADELDPNPTITPVLDLTQVQAKAKELASLTTVDPITAAISNGHAVSISSSQNGGKIDETPAQGGTSISLEQNNYSPESLSSLEIYRQTRTQLSQLRQLVVSAKGA